MRDGRRLSESAASFLFSSEAEQPVHRKSSLNSSDFSITCKDNFFVIAGNFFQVSGLTEVIDLKEI